MHSTKASEAYAVLTAKKLTCPREGSAKRPAVRHNSRPVQHWPFYLCNLAWNYALGIGFIAVPLRASSLGLTAGDIGMLLSAPVIAQMVLALLGGALVDRMGGRRIILVSCSAMLAGGVALVFAQGFWTLVLGQGLTVLSRSSFWPSSWALASAMPEPKKVFGRFNSIVNAGQILGTASAGFMIALGGFTLAFGTLAAMAAVGIVTAFELPHTARKAGGLRVALQGYRDLLSARVIYFAVFSSFLSALPLALSTSFYPLLFEHLGYGSDESGLLVSARALGAIAAGILLARWIQTGPRSAWTAGWGVATGITAVLLPFLDNAWLTLSLLLFAGAASVAVGIYSQVLMTESTRLEQRGLASGLTSQGWVLSLLVVPATMGVIADRWGLETAFLVMGTAYVLLALAGGPLNRWAYAGRAARDPAG